MAIQTKVNPNTIQRTYSEMERLGIVETRRGQGTFIAEKAEIVDELKERLTREVEGFVKQMKELGLTKEEMVEGLKHSQREVKMEIKLEHVSKKYGRHTAVDDVSFTLSSGRIYGLIGPNGSGKSTTLKMMAGLLFPTSGFVKVDGKQATRDMVRQTAYLTELDMFYPDFTVKDMVNFYQSQFPDFQTEQAYRLLNEMQLDPEKKIKKLSKGNRGRLKIVLALARQADVILLDEPFSGLDPMVRDSIVNSLVSYIDFEQQIVVIATHEIDEIETLLDEVIILANGEKVAQREVEDIREQEGMSVLQWFKSKMEVC